MRLVLRILGTWLLGLALILLVIDGTRSLGANSIVLTSFMDAWGNLHADSIEAVRSFLQTRFFAEQLHVAFDALLTYPAFAVVGVPGILFALIGQKPRRERYLRGDQV
jgi:hypothetical protein